MSTCTPSCTTVSDPTCGLRGTTTCFCTAVSRPCTITCPCHPPLRQRSILPSACHCNSMAMLAAVLVTRWVWRHFRHCAPLRARPAPMGTSFVSEYHRMVWNKKWWTSCETLPMPRRGSFFFGGFVSRSPRWRVPKNGCNTSECKTAAKIFVPCSLYILPLCVPFFFVPFCVFFFVLFVRL